MFFTGKLLSSFFKRNKRPEGETAEKETQEKGGWKRIPQKERSLVILFVMLLAAKLLMMGGKDSNPPGRTYFPVQIGTQKFLLEVFKTEAELRQGLMYRPSIPEGEGALFVLERAQKVTVTMKNVNFPLQVCTLDGKFQVLEVAEMFPDQPDHTFEQPCLFFMEVGINSRIKPGDLVGETDRGTLALNWVAVNDL